MLSSITTSCYFSFIIIWEETCLIICSFSLQINMSCVFFFQASITVLQFGEHLQAGSYVNCFYASKISNLTRTINLLIITFSFCFLLSLYGLLSTRSAYFHQFSLYFVFSQISPNCKGLKGHLRCIMINILAHDSISN